MNTISEVTNDPKDREARAAEIAKASEERHAAADAASGPADTREADFEKPDADEGDDEKAEPAKA